MENLNINTLLNRDDEVAKIKQILTDFEENKRDLTIKRGIYIYGNPGSGITTFIETILKEQDYDIVKYDAGDIRNKSVVDTIAKHNMADRNILSMYHKKIKRISIIMDEIDGMNTGDKGGINSLIKIVRPKKTKKQRNEETTMNPIICIGNYHVDKKIKELMKVCHVIELKVPTIEQISSILSQLMPSFQTNTTPEIRSSIVQYIQGDLRKLNMIYKLYTENQNIFNTDVIKNIFLPKSYCDDTRKITKQLINTPHNIDTHLLVMSETDRTIVGLLWHENIIDVLSKTPKKTSVPLYGKILENICYADFVDRITFQKQIWQFNEMSSLIKTFNSNKIYHDAFQGKKKQKMGSAEVRFTKVLTKYSTEYNNYNFIQNLCQDLSMDKTDLFGFFLSLRNRYSDAEILELLEPYNVGKLDIGRIYRYLDKYIKPNIPSFADEDIDEYLCNLE